MMTVQGLKDKAAADFIRSYLEGSAATEIAYATDAEKKIQHY